MNAAEKAEPWWAWGDPIKWERTKRWTERSVHIRRMFSSNFTRRGNSRSRLGGGTTVSAWTSLHWCPGEEQQIQSLLEEGALLEPITRA